MNLTSTLKKTQVIEMSTKIERYNNGSFPIDKKGCVLNWWKAHCKDFPILGSLARDYLACPASSASVERTFLAAAKVCSTGRAGLAIRTIEHCISSHMWLRNGVKMGGDFSDCQALIDQAHTNPKFKKYKGKTRKSTKSTKAASK